MPDLRAVVDPPHILHQEVDHRALRADFDRQKAFRVVAVNSSGVNIVHISHHPVLHFREVEPFAERPRHLRPVVDEAEVLPARLHRRRPDRFGFLRQTVEFAEQRRAPGQLHLAVGDLADRFRRTESDFREVFANPPLTGEELRRRVAPLGERAVVVVAGHRRRVVARLLPVAVGPGGEAEVGAAAEHVEVQRGPGSQHRIQFFGNVFRVAGVMLLTPVVEPAVPEFHAEIRPLRAELAAVGEGFHRAAAEIERLEAFRDRSAQNHPVLRPVRGEQRNVDPVIEKLLADMLKIRFVVAVAAVFILDLHHDDRAARRAQVLFHPRQHFIEVAVVGGEKGRIHAAEFNSRLDREPGRQPAVVPLRTDVRAGADDGVHPRLVHLVEKRLQVEYPGKVELTRLRLVQIVAEIGLDRVEPHHLRLGDAVRPLRGMNPKIVDGSGKNPGRNPVQPDRPGADFDLLHEISCY